MLRNVSLQSSPAWSSPNVLLNGNSESFLIICMRNKQMFEQYSKFRIQVVKCCIFSVYRP